MEAGFTTGMCLSAAVAFSSWSCQQKGDLTSFMNSNRNWNESSQLLTQCLMSEKHDFSSPVCLLLFLPYVFSGFVLYKVWWWWIGCNGWVLWMLLEERGFCWSHNFRTGTPDSLDQKPQKPNALLPAALLTLRTDCSSNQACLPYSTISTHLAVPQDKDVL